MTSILSLSYKLLILSWITAKRQLIHNRTAQRSIWDQSYDFIVVGSGPGGSIVANRLTENLSTRVLLLEAGGPQDAIYTDIPEMYSYITQRRPDIEWNYFYEPQDNVGLSYPTHRIGMNWGRVLGGSSTHNRLAYIRGNRRDYDNWAQTYGAVGWSYKDVLPYFKRTENNTDLDIVKNNPGYHSTSGPAQVSSNEPEQITSIIHNLYNELGLRTTDVNGANQTGSAILQSFINCRRLRSGVANAYIDPNPHPNNLHIVTNALVIKILFNGLTAVGVEFVRNGTSYRVYANKEVIISAGPVQTPQLLMLSGVGPEEHLKKIGIKPLINLPVGNTLGTYISIVYNARIIDPELYASVPQLTMDQIGELYFTKSGPLSQVTILALIFSTRSNINKQWPNVICEINFTGDMVTFILVVKPKRNGGRIRLQSTSPFLQPKIYANFLQDEQDVINAIEASKFILYSIERTPISQYLRLIPDPYGCPSCGQKYRYQCNEGIVCYIRNQATPVLSGSTCPMGATNRSESVVDPCLRVNHAQKLRVCDSSIFPMLPNMGNNAPSFMIGEKCAQIIKDNYNMKSSVEYDEIYS